MKTCSALGHAHFDTRKGLALPTRGEAPRLQTCASHGSDSIDTSPGRVRMSSLNYVQYRGLPFPPDAHTTESFQFAENLSVEDTDVFAVTFPKSGIVSHVVLLE